MTKKFKLKKRRQSLPVDITSRKGGRLLLRLVRRGQVVARLQTSLESGLSERRLRLPRKLRTGKYVLEYSFLAIGAADATTARTKITFVR